MAATLLDVRHAANRLRDIGFALDEMSRAPELFGRVDPGRAAVAGHSFGAWTVTHMLGERLPPVGLALLGLGGGGLEMALPDPRLRAGVALSPIAPIGISSGVAFGPMTAPVLHVTGTEDRGYIEAATPADRQVPYRASRGPAVLAVLAGARHASFAGEPGIGAQWNEPTYQGRIAALAVAFLRAELMGDAAARGMLLKGTMLASGDHLESRDF